MASTAPVGTAPPLPQPSYRVRLLGAVQALGGAAPISHFPSRPVAVLLARLALLPERAHPRDELVALLWPGVDAAVGRGRLRNTLSTLRSLLEGQPSGVGPLVLADREVLRAAPGAFACDGVAFEQAVRQGQFARAQGLYGGELMPGFYDDWIVAERQRLAALFERCLAKAEQQAATPEARPDAAALPAYLTRLFGAEQATARLLALVQEHRLVTLLGPGGSGKTRLAVEVAQLLRMGSNPLSGRVVFASLVACENQEQALEVVARAFGVHPASVVAALSGQPTLLVLDNLEQLLPAAQSWVAQWLAALPLLHVLTTSRRALALAAEQVCSAEPLALVALDAPLAKAADSPAVALLVDRARAARSDFELTAHNLRAVISLTHVLQGQPLALELAASRIRSFGPAELLGLLTAANGALPDSPQPGLLPLLARAGPRTGNDLRHASMSHVIAWSWRLLPVHLHGALVALTVFSGNASALALAAAAGMATDAGAPALHELVSHSMVRVQPGTGTGTGPAAQRFGLLEPVREFTLAQTDAAPLRQARQRLRQWYTGWVQAVPLRELPAAVAPELATLQALMVEPLADTAQAEATVALAVALRDFWETDAAPGRVLDALEQALDRLEATPANAGLRADAHELLAYLRFEAGFLAQAVTHADAALLAAGADPVRRARALVRRVWVYLASVNGRIDLGGDGEHVQDWLGEAHALASAHGAHDELARVLRQQGVVLRAAHKPLQAEPLFAQSQALSESLGDTRKAQARLLDRARCRRDAGFVADALAHFAQCEQAAAEDGNWALQIDALIALASFLGDQRRWAEAVAAGQRCVRVSWQRWHRHGLAYALWNLPLPLARLRQPEAALRLMAFASTNWSSQFGPLDAADQRYVQRVRRLVRAQVGAAQVQVWWPAGAAMGAPAAVQLAGGLSAQ